MVVSGNSGERSLYDETRAAKEQLVEMGTLANILAHDLVNIVTTISGNTQIIQNSVPPEDKDVFDSLSVAICRLKMVACQFRSFSRMADLRISVVDLSGVLDRVVKANRSSWRDLGITVLAKCPPNVGFLECHEETLQQLILNLSRIATDVVSSGDTLELTIDFQDNDLIVEVRATVSALGNVKRMSSVEDSTLVRSAQQILVAHGGRLDCHIEEGSRITFRLLLPKKWRSTT
jgi:nitrogen-specific signal transduction histidine kinase